MGISNRQESSAGQPRVEALESPDDAIGTPPVICRGVVYQSRLAAHIATLLDGPQRISHRRHKLLVDGEEHPVVPDLWLPEDNRFIFVYAQWPAVEECRRHAAVAALGHLVTVFVGAGLGPMARTRDIPDVTHGWTLDAFTGELQRGWTTFGERDNRPRICQATSPVQCQGGGIVLHMQAARTRVDEPAESDLSTTLGKSLRLQDS